MSKKKTVLTPWRLVPVGGKVILKGKKWKVEAKRVDKKTGAATVTIKGRQKTFAPKEKVELVLSDHYGDVSDDAVKLAKKAHEKRHGKKRKKPKVTAAEDWKAPAEDKAGKLVEKKLKGDLVGVKLKGSDEYFVPLVDPSTIAAHVFTFHAFIPESKAYEPIKALHDAEHERFEAGTGTLHIPHWHTAKKPTAVKK